MSTGILKQHQNFSLSHQTFSQKKLWWLFGHICAFYEITLAGYSISVQGLVTPIEGYDTSMIRTLSVDKEADFFERYSGLVHSALKRRGVWRSHADYDDFVQQGLMKLVEAYENYPNELNEEDGKNPFAGYAYQRVSWHVQDLLRKQQRKWESEMSWPEEMESTQADTHLSIEQGYEEMALLKEMLPLLNDKEQQYLIDAVVNRLNVTEIAQKQGVNRKTVYEWKKKVAVKLAHFLVDLKE